MSTKQQVEARAKALAVEIIAERRGRGFDIEMLAPDGQHFAGTGTHAVVNNAPTAAQAWAGALSDITFGLEACDPADEGCSEWAAEPMATGGFR